MALSVKRIPFDSQLREWQTVMLGTDANGIQNQGFWKDDSGVKELGPMRILVCGNSGVGKSTLINKVFVVDATRVSLKSCIVASTTVLTNNRSPTRELASTRSEMNYGSLTGPNWLSTTRKDSLLVKELSSKTWKGSWRRKPTNRILRSACMLSGA